MPLWLELLPQATSAGHLGKLVVFSVVLSVVMACLSVGLTDPLSTVSPELDPLQRVSSAAGNFVGLAIFGMVIFILPFGLGGLGFGYVIEHDADSRNRISGLGFVSGAFLGFSILFGFIVAPSSSTPAIVAAGFGAVAGFGFGIVVSSIRRGPTGLH